MAQAPVIKCGLVVLPFTANEVFFSVAHLVGVWLTFDDSGLKVLTERKGCVCVRRILLMELDMDTVPKRRQLIG